MIGLGFSTERDQLVRFRFYVSRHTEGEPTEPDLTGVTMDQLGSGMLTKRICLRIVSS